MGELIDKLIEYSESDNYSFHMPGHKGNIEPLDSPFKYDITEIDGFDDLHEAEDVLLRLKGRLARLYGGKDAYILVNGSTGGIHIAISAVIKKGEKILISRNSHKAVYNGVFLNEVECEYVYPQINEKTGINSGLSAKNVDKMLKKDPKIRAVMITSPTYEGITSDVSEIAKVVHRNNIPLIVDAAHGAHFGQDDFFPENPVKLGADIVIMSLHKTLPALTQTGVMCVSGDIVDYEKVKKYYDIYTTSSPSYLFMSSVEYCVDFMTKRKDKFAKYSSLLQRFYKECKLNNLYFYETDDKGKIVVVTSRCNINGKELGDLLRKEGHIEPEMISSQYVILMTSVCDTEEGFDRLKTTLEKIDGTLSAEDKSFIYPAYEPEVFCRIDEAEDFEEEIIELECANGRVSRNFIYAYPPGIPIVAPGEVINSKIIEIVNEYYNSGIKLCGINADMKVRVCKTEG